jgi:hypothetical protein
MTTLTKHETTERNYATAERLLYLWACGKISDTLIVRVCAKLGFAVNPGQSDTDNLIFARDANGQPVTFEI